MTQGIQDHNRDVPLSLATFRDQVFLALVANVAAAPTVLEAREGEVVLLSIPITVNEGSPIGDALRHVIWDCLYDLAVTGSILSHTPIGVTTATGDYVYVVLRPRPTAAPAGSSAEIGCAPTD